jgi:arginine/lysine/ornithine decarboxylase
MARNGHKSAFAGLILSGARPVYVEPYYDEQLEAAHEVLADEAPGHWITIPRRKLTLSGLSQTSVLLVGSDRIDTQRLTCFDLEESTSSSGLLILSIDGARAGAQFVRDGRELIPPMWGSIRLQPG